MYHTQLNWTTGQIENLAYGEISRLTKPDRPGATSVMLTPKDA